MAVLGKASLFGVRRLCCLKDRPQQNYVLAALRRCQGTYALSTATPGSSSASSSEALVTCRPVAAAP
jgi:hypothetical protein